MGRLGQAGSTSVGMVEVEQGQRLVGELAWGRGRVVVVAGIPTRAADCEQ